MQFVGFFFCVWNIFLFLLCYVSRMETTMTVTRTSRSNNSNSRSSSTISNTVIAFALVRVITVDREGEEGCWLIIKVMQDTYSFCISVLLPSSFPQWRKSSELRPSKTFPPSILFPRQDRWSRRCCGCLRKATLLLSESVASQPSLNVNCIALVLADILPIS